MSDEQATNESKKQTASMAAPVEYVNIQRFYANHFQVNLSLFEIRLVANFLTGVNEKGHLVALETMLISLSPETAQAVYNLLGRALESYKSQYGPLRFSAATPVKLTHDLNLESKQAMDMADVMSPPEEEHK